MVGIPTPSIGGSKSAAQSSTSGPSIDNKNINFTGATINLGEVLKNLSGPAENGGFGVPSSRIIPAAFQSTDAATFAARTPGLTPFDWLLILGVGGFLIWRFVIR